MTRILIIVQNLPVPFDRRVWLECQALTAAGYQVAVVCPKGKGDPGYQVVDGVELYKYRPYAPGGSKLSFVAEYAYSFLATAWLTSKARRRGRFAVIQACNPPDIFWPIAMILRALDGPSSCSTTTTCAPSSSSPVSRAGPGLSALPGPAGPGAAHPPGRRPRDLHQRLLPGHRISGAASRPTTSRWSAPGRTPNG